MVPVRHKGEYSMSYAIEASLAPASTSPSMEHQTLELSELSLLRLILNQVDYGLVVVDTDNAKVRFANQLGRDTLQDTPTPQPPGPRRNGLRLYHGRVLAHQATDTEQLNRILQRTKNGVRGLLCMGDGRQSSAVAVLPLADQAAAPPSRPRFGAPTAASYALLVFAKQQLCDESTMALFARERGLTSAEGQVLALVCKGLRPAQIASKHGVRISTVRTQLRSIRMKTFSTTIRDLVQQVSVLPPMARHFAGQPGL